MTTVILYYGPQIGFEECLSKNGVNREGEKTLLEFAKITDELKQQIYVDKTPPKREPTEVDNIISYSDEYASLNEHVILNFNGLLSEFAVKNIFLHNPPKVIAEQIKRRYPDLKIEKYKYKQLSKDDLYSIISNFDDRIIGQIKAKQSLLRTLVQITNPNNKKPLVVLFYGPTGVGKSETAKYLAKEMGGTLFNQQFSMFQNNDYATYLFGGKHNQNSFAKEILERETNVLLLDEFDKANSVFHSAFYQLFDEGKFEDKNYNVDVGNAIIICTSNYQSEEEIRKKLGEPIFSRFEACIPYEKISPHDAKKIIKIHINKEWDMLPPEDQLLINKKSIENNFDQFINRMNNVRNIQSLVRQAIFDKILTELISEKKDENKIA